MSKLLKSRGKAVFHFGGPFFSYEVQLDGLLDSKTVDERITRLAEVRRDLEAAVDAVTSLQQEAHTRKTEVEKLQDTVTQLQEDKQSAEKLLALPQESVARVIGKASSKGRVRGLIEGIVIGLVTGIISSAIVRYFTSGVPSVT